MSCITEGLEFMYLKITDVVTSTEVVYDAIDFDGITLNYNGGDEKFSTMAPSEIQFALIDKAATDARYKFITDQSNRYAVELVMLLTGMPPQTMWRGWLVPAEYAEPVTAINTVVQFTAIDGLATLNEKYIENTDRYVNVIALLQELVYMTGLQYPLSVMTAINNNAKAWNEIMIDLRKFKGQTAYEILDELLLSMAMQLYFECDKWHFEAWNLKQSLSVAVYNVDVSGAVTTATETRGKRYPMKYMPEPMIRFSYPYKKISVLPIKTERIINNLSSYDDFDYMHSNSVLHIPVPSWYTDTVMLSYLSGGSQDGKYKVIASRDPMDESRYIFYNFYVEKGAKVEIKGQVTLPGGVVIGDDSLRYKFKINDKVVQANYTTSEGYIPLYFDTENTIVYKYNKADINYKFEAFQSGYFQLYIYFASPHEYTIDAFAIDVIDPTPKIEINNNAAGYDYEVEIPIYPDIRNVSKSFIVEDVSYPATTPHECRIFYKREIDGLNYLFINVYDAEIMKRYIDTIQWNGVDVAVREIIYNYLGAESVVVVVDDMSIDDTHPLVVATHAPDNTYSLRQNYTDWYDNYYGIGSYSYTEMYAKMLQQLHKQEFVIIDAVFYEYVWFSNFLQFDYRGVRTYRPSNISINIFAKQSTVLMHEQAYEVDSLSQHLPYIYAPTPIIIGVGDDTATLQAQIVDVDSTVGAINWTESSGSGTTIANPNQPVTEVSGLTDNYYKYEIEVEDDVSGVSVFKAVEVVRRGTYSFVLTEIFHDDTVRCEETWRYRMDVSPVLPDDMIMLLDLRISKTGYGTLKVWKNGVLIMDDNDVAYPTNLRVSYTVQDKIEVEFVDVDYDNASTGDCDYDAYNAEFEIQRVEIIRGVGDLSGIPYLFEKYI